MPNLFWCLFPSIKQPVVHNKTVQEREWCMQAAWVDLLTSSETNTRTLREQASSAGRWRRALGERMRPVPQTQSPLLRRDLHLNEGYADSILKVVTLEPGPLHFPFALSLAHYAAGSERDSVNRSASRQSWNWKLLGRPSWVSPSFGLAQHSALDFGANEKLGRGIEGYNSPQQTLRVRIIWEVLPGLPWASGSLFIVRPHLIVLVQEHFLFFI